MSEHITDHEKHILDRARDFAIAAHWGQMYGSRPYYYHLDRVVELAKKAGLSTNTQVAAYLHDVVEDTDITANQVHEEFGYDIATLVYAVTDAESDMIFDDLVKEGHSVVAAKKFIRDDKKAKTYPKILAHPNGVHLKICDRIANVECSLLSKDKGMIEKYRSEAPKFKEKLFTPGVATELWESLDRLMLGKDR